MICDDYLHSSTGHHSPAARTANTCQLALSAQPDPVPLSWVFEAVQRWLGRPAGAGSASKLIHTASRAPPSPGSATRASARGSLRRASRCPQSRGDAEATVTFLSPTLGRGVPSLLLCLVLWRGRPAPRWLWKGRPGERAPAGGVRRSLPHGHCREPAGTLFDPPHVRSRFRFSVPRVTALSFAGLPGSPSSPSPPLLPRAHAFRLGTASEVEGSCALKRLARGLASWRGSPCLKAPL